MSGSVQALERLEGEATITLLFGFSRPCRCRWRSRLHEVAARHSHRRRLGNPPVRDESPIDTTEYPNTSDIQNPTGIDLSRTSHHPRETPTTANFFTPPRIIRSHKESIARMGQTEAYFAKDPNQSPVPPISALPSLTRYQGASPFSLRRQSTREDGDIDKFQAVVEQIGEEDEGKSKISSNEVSMDDMPLHHRRLMVLLISREPLSCTATHCYIGALVISEEAQINRT
ncbi:hypothetical protein EV421DRAFT_1973859 [Armillaria borealis]|uniref:Uncharacterized protein n=1 Tax=Armillaria borealis TaxID=47425 RepID=A0AA39MJZ9_9AGAR|nr:hypothetical protein EV421DRAFT_1973859 [Armillaria borealis]